MRKTIKFWLVIAALLFSLSALIYIFTYQSSFQLTNFPLRPKWQTRLNASITAISAPDGDIVFVYTNGALYALNANTGEKRWKIDLPWQGGYSGQPLVKNHLVYIANNESILAFNEQSGDLIWKHQIPYANGRIVDVSDKVVLVNQQGISIDAYDANIGRLLWQEPSDPGPMYAYIDKDKVYIPEDDIRAFDLLTGAVLWRNDDHKVFSNTAYQDGVLYSTAGAFDLRNQRLLWEYNDDNEGIIDFSFAGNTLFVTDAVYVCAWQPQTGVRSWCAKFPYPRRPVVLDGIAYVFNGNHKTIRAFDLPTGKEIGRLLISNLSWFVTTDDLLAASTDRLYFASGPQIFAFGK